MKIDLVSDMATAGIHALVSSRPDLSAEDLLVAIMRAARSASAEHTPAARAAPPPVVAPPPMAPNPRPTRRKRRKRRFSIYPVSSTPMAARKTKAAPKPAVRPLRFPRKPGRPPGRSPLSRRGPKAKVKPPLRPVPAARTAKNFRTRRELLDAIDRASDGMLARYLEVLDDGSPHLRELSAYAGRPPRWAFRTWADAVCWAAKEQSCRWADVLPDRLQRISEAMRMALSASAGGVSELSRKGLGAYLDLRLPAETEAVLARDDGEDVIRASGARTFG